MLFMKKFAKCSAAITITASGLVARMASLAERVENLALKLGEPLEPDAATS
jgi:20S proteasome alpha/beta subunit